ncbi:MAG: hypothetical protein PHI12_03195 [Dehalococcoidales bacterium]|nr:hypothetical protein [Dehalococcoidales bacterium]
MGKIATILGLIGAILIAAGGFAHSMNVVGGGGILLVVCFILWFMGKK